MSPIINAFSRHSTLIGFGSLIIGAALISIAGGLIGRELIGRGHVGVAAIAGTGATGGALVLSSMCILAVKINHHLGQKRIEERNTNPTAPYLPASKDDRVWEDISKKNPHINIPLGIMRTDPDAIRNATMDALYRTEDIYLGNED